MSTSILFFTAPRLFVFTPKKDIFPLFPDINQLAMTGGLWYNRTTGNKTGGCIMKKSSYEKMFSVRLMNYGCSYISYDTL